jgi:hypothetical protein
MPHPRHAVALALTGLSVLALPALAQAAPKVPKGKVARFDVVFTGAQAVTWDYHRPAGTGGSCLPHQTAGGTATITLAAPAPKPRLVAMEVKKGSPVYRLTKGRPFLATTTGADIAPRPTLTMTGHDEIGDTDNRCPEEGGGGADQPIGCGTTTGTPYGIRLAYADRNRLTVTGAAGEFAAPRDTTTTFLSTAFDNCPYWVGGSNAGGVTVSEGALAPVTVRLPEKQLFARARRKLVVRGAREDCYDGLGAIACGTASRPDPSDDQSTFAASVKTAWTLTLTRRTG